MREHIFENRKTETITGLLAYFSHSLSNYSNDEEIYNYLSEIFEGLVVCPRRHFENLPDPREYARIARDTDCVFVMPIEFGTNIISTGCFSEVSAAIKNSKKVLLVDKIGKSFTLYKVIDVVKGNVGKPFHYNCILS